MITFMGVRGKVFRPIFLLSIAGIIVFLALIAAVGTDEVIGYRANVVSQFLFVKRIWDGNGVVIVGRLALPEDARVSARIPIYADGRYCTALYSGRRLVFFAHGYEPLEITQRSKIFANIYDAGTRGFVKAAPENMRKLRATVTAKRLRDKNLPITSVLQIRNYEFLWDDEGNNSGDTITVAVRSRVLASGQKMEFDGLSRIPYMVVVTAPGYIKKELPINQGLTGVIDLGKIALEPAPSYRVAYKARVRQNGGKWIGSNAAWNGLILCDGDNEFQFSGQRDGLGNSLGLRMRPKDGSVEASFFYYKDNSFYDLGEFKAKELPSWDTVDISTLDGRTEARMTSGHLYYFTIDDINGTDIRMLFRVEKI